MDDIDTTIEAADDQNLAVEIGKALLVSTAMSVGTLAGFVVVGIAVQKVKSFKDARAAKKNPSTEN